MPLMQRAERLAAWGYKVDLLGMAAIVLMASILLCRSDPPPRFVLFFLVLPAGALALLSQGRRNLAGSWVLSAAILYLASPAAGATTGTPLAIAS